MRCLLAPVGILFACTGENDRQTLDGDTDTDTDPPPCAVVAEELPDAGMAIWMSDPSDVWIVGADGAGDPGGPMLFHYDGTSWTDLETGGTGKLQWVWSDGGDEVWMVGQGAQVVRYARSTGTFDVEVIADPATVLWGLWGSSASDLWAVSGDPRGALVGEIHHFDGASWSVAYQAPTDQSYALFKVWGSAADDVWAVGSYGLLVHYDGVSWTRQPAPEANTQTMFTVHGAGSDDATAVGGAANGAAWHYDGTSWAVDSPPPTAIAPAWTGTFSHPTWGTVACGAQQSIWWRASDERWTPDPRAIPTAASWKFHSCWIDDRGGVWATGGDLDSPALDHGVIAYCGDAAINPIE